MVDRQDHITRILGGGPQTDAEKVRAQAEARHEETAKPTVTPALVEYLERQFLTDIASLEDAGTVDELIALSANVGRINGARGVINHLKALLAAQQAERS